jgi:ABC-2 type transport system ATP-binding protein
VNVLAATSEAVGPAVEPAVAATGVIEAAVVDVPVIDVQGLVKRYGERTILDGVALRVGVGQLVALLGPNGAGKTTTVEIIEGYRRPDAGTVRVLGTDPSRGGPAHRARVGLMLQEGGIDPRVRPLEILRLFAAFFARPRDPGELLDLVGLTAVAGTGYRRLSGGEKQRLALAIALVGSPELLVLDEPTAGMDPAAKGATRALIEDLRSAGTTILLTTHDLADVERLADRVAILDRGRIVAEGTPAELTGGTAARLRFRLASPLTDPDLAALGTELSAVAPTASVVPDATDGLARYRVDGSEPDPALIAALAAWCSEQSVRIVELRSAGGTLEERYLELTGDGAVEGAGSDGHP